MKEEEVFHKMVDFLRKNGCKIVETNSGRQRGADIVAEKSGRETVFSFNVERFGSYFVQS